MDKFPSSGVALAILRLSGFAAQVERTRSEGVPPSKGISVHCAV